MFNRSDYNFYLPPNLIAQYPKRKRDFSKLLVLDRVSGATKENHFYDIVKILKKGDVLVLNQTKVFPARLFGKKSSGGKIEVFLIENKEKNIWKCLLKPASSVKKGAKIFFSESFYAVVIQKIQMENILEFFSSKESVWMEILSNGKTPLPPYIKRTAIAQDMQNYQTVYAKTSGSVAAPTAGLHFTDDILEKLKAKDVKICKILLHVGLGTFLPVKTKNIADHSMHSEYCQIEKSVAIEINRAKKDGKRIIAVGSTSARTLESFFSGGSLKFGQKRTNIFIFPGKKFNVVDGLLTNFHLPESTLIMMVAAFSGYKNTMDAYKFAIEKKYRFFSYGDAMLIL